MEEGIAKLKWEWMSEEMGNNNPKSLSDLAIEVALKDIMTEEEREELDEENEIQEAKLRLPYNTEEKGFNFARKRVTDFKGNTRVILPPKSKKL